MSLARSRTGNVSEVSKALTLPFGNRRRFISASSAVLLASTFPGVARGRDTPLRLGTTAVFLNEQLHLLDVWRADLQTALRRGVHFVQRRSYGEIIGLLLGGQLDAAWICGYPYAVNAEGLRLLAIPQYQGHPLYRSYLIVPASDQDSREITDLKGGVFAYSDPLSNSGYLVPNTELIRKGEDPATFFRKSFLTFAHSKVIKAVSTGLATGGLWTVTCGIR